MSFFLLMNLIMLNAKGMLYGYEDNRCKEVIEECHSKLNCQSEAHSYCWTFCAWNGEECEDYEIEGQLYCAEMWKDYCVCCGMWWVRCDSM